MAQHQYTNQLIHASSPYLLQHAHNPVDWFEWNQQALEKAKAEDKPILVSIGYSSCHWCHVMERESFENEDIAEIMNEYFICIKVDREERPDIDQVYMDAVQALGVRGGWPLNVFLTPEQKPFFGGTYFSPASWAQVLQNIHKAFQLNRKQIEGSAEDLLQHLLKADLAHVKPTAIENKKWLENLDASYQRLAKSFDMEWGGLDKAPKFIMPSIWRWLLRYSYIKQHSVARNHTVFTLKKIASGGIYDAIGGGFARYSVDKEWFAPHFEKMLYDNAQLIGLYAEAYAVTGDTEFKKVVIETFGWLQREMSHPDGGFYSALDADSEGIEGKYYIWKKAELLDLLKDDAELFCTYYHVSEEGNWEHESNILTRRIADKNFLTTYNLTAESWQEKLERCKSILLTARSSRIAPGLDDKIITAWNALMIAGLTDAYRYLGDEQYLSRACKAWNFLQRNLRDGDTIYRSFKQHRSAVTGFLDDYAYTIHAALALYQVTFDEEYLKQAARDLQYTISEFYDENEALFHYTGNSGQQLITRKKELFDNVIPSSNAVMAQNLFEAGTLMTNNTWKEMAIRMTEVLHSVILQEPNYMSHWSIVHANTVHGFHEVAIVGSETHQKRKQWQRLFHPFTVTLGTTGNSSLPVLQDKRLKDRQTLFFVCRNRVCQLPVVSVEEAVTQLQK